MLAYQFETEIKNGTIKIPASYQNGFGTKVKVLLLPRVERTSRKSSVFPDLKLRTKDSTFDREEAHER
jgi:hypothetical protein